MAEWPDWTEDDFEQAEQEDRAALATYFAQHPDVKPFTVGDKVLITTEARRRLAMFRVNIERWGQTATIGGYDTDRHSDVWMESVEASWVCPFPMALALRMRQAYLDQQAASPTNEG